MFTNKYAKEVNFRHDFSASGLGDATLVIMANIPLREASIGYDKTKVDELLNAAVAFAKDAQVRLEFWSVE